MVFVNLGARPHHSFRALLARAAVQQRLGAVFSLCTFKYVPSP